MDQERLSELLQDEPAFERYGCYVFCWRFGEARKPIYVGKAIQRRLAVEAFNARNKNRLAEYINDQGAGRLEIFLVTQDLAINGRGSVVIDEIEEYLIALAARRNRDLLNVHGAREKRWRIRGVVGRNAGYQGGAPLKLRRTLGLTIR